MAENFAAIAQMVKEFFDPSPGFAADAALAPPQCEVAAAPGGNYSWAKWFPIRQGPCKTFLGASPCGIESDMWTLARALLSPSHSILELGARYGTTSCVLAQVTRNSGRVVSVEPDPSAHAALRHNIRAHQCNVAVWRGTVGQTPQSILDPTRNLTYDRRTRTAAHGEASLPCVSPADLERLAGFAFDAWVIDCEGCLTDALSPEVLHRVGPRLELILLEADQPSRVSYSRWHLRLEAAGFRRIWRLADSLYGGFGPAHMAYQRGDRPLPSCRDFALHQPGWRCVHKLEHVRPGFDNPSLTCGSRMTCLSAAVVNGSREDRELQRERQRRSQLPWTRDGVSTGVARVG